MKVGVFIGGKETQVALCNNVKIVLISMEHPLMNVSHDYKK